MASFSFTEAERSGIVALARQALREWLGLEAPAPVLSPRITREKRGVFVTLRQLGELRGCIGYVEPVEPLSVAVKGLAVKAASEDPRFPPVVRDDLGTLTIEISVLSPLRACADIRSIEIGKHGLVVEQGWKRGLLLPEVASEAGWDAPTFVRHCCTKAGLPRTAWEEPGTRIYTFESEHFGESIPGEMYREEVRP